MLQASQIRLRAPAAEIAGAVVVSAGWRRSPLRGWHAALAVSVACCLGCAGASALRRGQTAERRITTILPILPLPVEVTYALIERYPIPRPVATSVGVSIPTSPVSPVPKKDLPKKE